MKRTEPIPSCSTARGGRWVRNTTNNGNALRARNGFPFKQPPYTSSRCHQATPDSSPATSPSKREPYSQHLSHSCIGLPAGRKLMLQRDGEIAAPASVFRHQDTVQQHRRLVRQLRLMIVRANKLRVRTCSVSAHDHDHAFGQEYPYVFAHCVCTRRVAGRVEGMNMPRATPLHTTTATPTCFVCMGCMTGTRAQRADG